jgi:hypothetical protein
VSDIDPLDVINEMLRIDGVVTVYGNEIKCWVSDGSGGRVKNYLTEDDCDTLASAFTAMARRLAGGLSLDRTTQATAKENK